MNTIKFLPNKNILLNNKLMPLKKRQLTKIKHTNEYTSWYTIKNNNYVEL